MAESTAGGLRITELPSRTPGSLGLRRDAMEWADVSFLLVLFGGAILFLAILAIWILRKPRLAVVSAPPEAVRRDLAYRIRTTGHPVEVVKDVLRVRIDSLAALKLHVRASPRGTEIRYEVDATGLGWTLVLVFALISYLAVIALAVAVVIHWRAQSFARSRVKALLAQPPLGTLPSQDVRSLIVEGLSEAQRLSEEALEYEREARQNAIGIVLVAAVALWGIVFAVVGIYALLPLPNSAAAAALLAFLVSGTTAVLGSWLVYVRRAPRIRELERDARFYRSASTEHVLATEGPSGARGTLEMLLHAATRSPYWREIRRSRRFWHDPIAGLTMFILAYGALFLPFLAIIGSFLSWEWRIFLGAFGAILAAGGIWFVRSWTREIQEQDERDRRGWEERRAAIEAELWRILSG